jgi:hypothetical protein
MYTQGTDNSGKTLSVFLNVPDCEQLASGWARRQAFRLIAIDQLDPSNSVIKGEPTCRGPVPMRWYRVCRILIARSLSEFPS